MESPLSWPRGQGISATLHREAIHVCFSSSDNLKKSQCLLVRKIDSLLHFHLFWCILIRTINLKRHSKPSWACSCDTCSRWPCLGRRDGLDNLQRSFPTLMILWLCETAQYFCELFLDKLWKGWMSQKVRYFTHLQGWASFSHCTECSNSDL